MTEVSFYVLPDAAPAARLQFACRLAAKAWRRGLPVFIHGEPGPLSELDTLLWEFRPASFVPHRRSDDPSLPPSPVELGQHDSPAHHHGLLINLGSAIPDWFSRFDYLAEIVCQDAAVLDALRERYRFYQGRGYPLKRHTLDAAGH